MRQLKIDVLSVLVVTDKLEFVRQLASASKRKISPGRGVRTLAGGKSASALAAPGKLKKNIGAPEG